MLNLNDSSEYSARLLSIEKTNYHIHKLSMCSLIFSQTQTFVKRYFSLTKDFLPGIKHMFESPPCCLNLLVFHPVRHPGSVTLCHNCELASPSMGTCELGEGIQVKHHRTHCSLVRLLWEEQQGVRGLRISLIRRWPHRQYLSNHCEVLTFNVRDTKTDVLRLRKDGGSLEMESSSH